MFVTKQTIEKTIHFFTIAIKSIGYPDKTLNGFVWKRARTSLKPLAAGICIVLCMAVHFDCLFKAVRIPLGRSLSERAP